MDPVSGSLRLSRVTLSDEGNYACVVNTTGHSVAVSTNAHLYVESETSRRYVFMNSIFYVIVSLIIIRDYVAPL